MSLLTRRQLPELLLWEALHKALKTHKRLETILAIQKLPLRPPDQLLNLQQTTLVQVCTQTIIHLLKHLLQEPIGVLLLPRLRGDNLIHETSRNELLTGNALAHDERLVGLRNTETLDEGAAGAALGDKTERRERRQEERVRSSVDEICMGHERSGETDRRSVQGDDKDLRVVVEAAGDVGVVGDESLHQLATNIAAKIAVSRAGACYVGTARAWPLAMFLWIGIQCPLNYPSVCIFGGQRTQRRIVPFQSAL